jgi:hypothetical protein
MTPSQQRLWQEAGRMAWKETAKINDGKFDDLFFRVSLDYYSILLTNHVTQSLQNNKSGEAHANRR